MIGSMIDIDLIDAVLNATKRFRSNKARQLKHLQHDGSALTDRAMSKRNANIAWINLQLEKDAFALHTAIVRAGLAGMFDHSYYTDDIHSPSSFHSFDFKRPHPLKDFRR
jgi:hypothetical protein